MRSESILSFCCLHAISNKLLFAQRLEIMNLSDFINSKSDDLRIFGKIVLNEH